MSATNPFQAPIADGRYSTRELAAPLSLGEILFSFDGRIGRQTYWLATLGCAFAFYALLFVLVMLGVPEDLLTLVTLVAYIPMIWSSLAIQTKRWHDRDKSGLWILIGFVPLIGGLWAFVECGLLAGTPGSNEFGRDPIGY